MIIIPAIPAIPTRDTRPMFVSWKTIADRFVSSAKMFTYLSDSGICTKCLGFVLTMDAKCFNCNAVECYKVKDIKVSHHRPGCDMYLNTAIPARKKETENDNTWISRWYTGNTITYKPIYSYGIYEDLTEFKK